jgi:hypothetical protein
LSTHLGYSRDGSNRNMELLHETQQQHPLRSVFFSQPRIRYFDVLYIRHVRMSTHQYSKGKKEDDINIIFRMNDINTFGKITCIFTVENGRPLLLVDYLQKTMPLQYTISSNASRFYYEHIRYDNTSTKKTCLIVTTDFIEKCVYFESSKHMNYYFRFPSLCHSS